MEKFETEIEVCAHRVGIRYFDIPNDLTDGQLPTTKVVGL